jgi:transposase-like protein
MSTKRTQKSYDNEFKAQAVKLAQEIGGHKAAKELGVPDGTIYCWIKAFKEGRLSANEAIHTPQPYPLTRNLSNLESVLKNRRKKFAA